MTLEQFKTYVTERFESAKDDLHNDPDRHWRAYCNQMAYIYDETLKLINEAEKHFNNNNND